MNPFLKYLSPAQGYFSLTDVSACFKRCWIHVVLVVCALPKRWNNFLYMMSLNLKLKRSEMHGLTRYWFLCDLKEDQRTSYMKNKQTYEIMKLPWQYQTIVFDCSWTETRLRKCQRINYYHR